MYEIKGAQFSADGKHRYSLWRIWDTRMPLVMFIGLNPSTADNEKDDPTIRRVRAIAYNLGYGGVFMCNCFTYISTDPKCLQGQSKEDIQLNLERLRKLHKDCKDVIFAWGNFPIVREYGVDKMLSEAFPDAKALHINKNGSPKHPLYCKALITPVLYKYEKENTASDAATAVV